MPKDDGFFRVISPGVIYNDISGWPGLVKSSLIRIYLSPTTNLWLKLSDASEFCFPFFLFFCCCSFVQENCLYMEHHTTSPHIDHCKWSIIQEPEIPIGDDLQIKDLITITGKLCKERITYVKICILF